MHRSSFTIGILGEPFRFGSNGTILIAPTGQWRAQFPHDTPSVTGKQFAFTHTAWPI